MNEEFYKALEALQQEKGIPQKYMLEKIRAAIGTDHPTRLVITLGYAKEDEKLRPKKRKELGELVRFVD